MHRWLALFLMVLLPLLSGWSAASAYCGSERDDATRHGGHHVDARHDGAQTNSLQQSQVDSAHADCDHCHSPGATPRTVIAAGPTALPTLTTPWSDTALRAPPLSLPERPKWARFA